MRDGGCQYNWERLELAEPGGIRKVIFEGLKSIYKKKRIDDLIEHWPTPRPHVIAQHLRVFAAKPGAA